MRIAILSWGSLVGEPRDLEILDGWTLGGPFLPVEYSRISQSGDRAGCLTLVIDEQNGENSQTHFAESANTNLNAAIKNMRLVEGGRLKCSIGYVNLVSGTQRGFAADRQPISCGRISEWAEANEFDAVIWTSLLANFEYILSIPFTVENALQYLNGLPEPTKTKAFNYIRESPAAVVTPLRRALGATHAQ